MRKYKALITDILKEISKTRNRFLSIMLIVMLGSGFFAGVKSTCPDMIDTAEKYFAERNLMDFNIKSTMGFSDNDIEALHNDPNVKDLYAGYTADMFLEHNGDMGSVSRVFSIDIDKIDDESTINRLLLKEGRMPQTDNECVIDQGAFKGGGIEVGDVIRLYVEEGKEVSDVLHNDEFTVVGLVNSPMYIGNERGRTTIGNGSIVNTIYIAEEVFAYEVITDVFITYNDMRGLAYNGDEYENLRMARGDELEIFAEGREKTRKHEIYDEALKAINEAEAELNDGIAEYEEGKATFDREIAKAEKDLKNAKYQIENGKKEIEENAKKLHDGWIEYYKGLGALEQSEKQLNGFNEMFDKMTGEISEATAVADEIKAYVDELMSSPFPEDSPLIQGLSRIVELAKRFDIAGVIDLSGMIERLPFVKNVIERIQLAKEIFAILEQYEATYMESIDKLFAQKDNLESSIGQLSDAYIQLEDAKKQLDDGERELEKGRKKIEQGEKDYEIGLKEFEEKKAEGEKELADAYKKIEEGKAEILKARHDLNEMGDPEWYIFDRTDNMGYSDFSNDAERVDNIAKVFPVFFIIVAALVCLTTMTRMVEEQRVQIGTLKSLGYGKGAAVAKYLVYAVSASLIGSILGLCIGFVVIPVVVYNAYRIMYVLPSLEIVFRWDYAVGCTAVAVAVTSIAALSACAVELKEVPAQLLRPKPPKTGKRVLLERIGIIWNHLSFLQKVSARNIFRYKKRIYMTIIGVAGCTALMFAGFGLRYAISSIVDKQYDSIFVYDLIGMNKDNLTKLELDEIRSQFEKDENITDFALVRQETFSFEKDRNKVDADIIVPESMEGFDTFIHFQERKSGQPVVCEEGKAVITEKLAKLLEANIGDTIALITDTGGEIAIEVGGITENYVSHYVYMSDSTYESLTGEKLSTNAFLLELSEDCDNDAFGTRLLENNNILGFGFSEESGDKFRELVGSLNYIVIVIIVAAGALAFVVLYNLANINVEERIREIATIKVLGFYDNEVSSYVSRESFISSFMGMAAGLALGIPFLRFIVATAEVDMVMFNPAIRWDTYLWAGALTMVFTLIVDRAMYKRLKKVDMVSSLKSVE